MKSMRKLATVALLAVTVAVLVPGVASANEPYPGQTLIPDPLGLLPDVCIQPDGSVALCDPYHEPVVTFPGILDLGNLLADPPIFDPGLLFPVDPGTGEEAPDDDTPAEPPAAEEPSDDSAEGDAPVEEPVTEEPHAHAPVTSETPATEVPASEVPATDAAPSDAASQTTAEAAVETTQSPEAKQVSGDSTDGGSQEADVTALEQLPAELKGFPMWAALLAGFGGAFALFGSYLLGKKDV